MLSTLSDLLSRITLSSLIDVSLVALIFFGLFYLIQGTRAVQVMRGVLLVVFLTVLASNVFHLTAFTWLIRNILPALLVSIPVIFQPELRRALERLGRPETLIARPRVRGHTIKTVARSANELARRRLGALIVLEGVTGLNDYIDTGVALDAQLSTDLLLSIFHKNAALHDGAVIVREDRVVAATCMLPLSDNQSIARNVGTRHRAALGVTEGTDATVVVVSEQTGAISIAHNGKLVRSHDEGELARLLNQYYRPPSTIGRWRSGNNGNGSGANGHRK